MLEKNEILTARIIGIVDKVSLKNYSFNKSLTHIQTEVEMIFPNINKETKHNILKYAKQRFLLNTTLEKLQISLFKQRYEISELNPLVETTPLIKEEEIEVDNE